MRLIDADALIMDYITDDAENDSEIISRNDILNAPTVDAVPVVHGHWIIDGHHRICSVCDNYNCLTDKENDKIADDFCPKCGAKMG